MLSRIGLLVLDAWASFSLGAVGGAVFGLLVGAILVEVLPVPHVGKFPKLEANFKAMEVGAVVGSVSMLFLAVRNGFRKQTISN